MDDSVSIWLGECIQGAVHYYIKEYLPARLNLCII